MKNLLRYLAFVLMVGGALAQNNSEIEKQKTNTSLVNSTIYVFMDTNYGAVVSRYNLKVEGVEMPQIHGYKYLEFVVPTGQYLIEADRTDIGGTSVTLKVGAGEKHYVFVDPVGFPRPKPILRIVDEVRGKEGVSKSVELVIPEKNQKILEQKGVFLAKNLLNNSPPQSYGVAATVGPVIGTQISDFQISRNEVLPLPPGQWRVRSNTSWGFCEPAKRPNCGDGMGRVVVLENTQSDTPIYSIVVRYTDAPVNNWSLNWCYEPNRDYKDTHKTNNSNAVRKCSRGWDEGLSLSRSTNPSMWYWQGVIDNLPMAAERGSFKTHLEVNLQANNQRSYSIDIFIARDLDGDLLKHEAIMRWKSLFADVAANGLFKGETLVKREMLAIGKSSTSAHSQVETISGVFEAGSAADEDAKKQLAAQQSTQPIQPAVSSGAERRVAKPISNDSAGVQQPTSQNIELDRLRAEADEAKRKQAELEIKLRVAQQERLLAEAEESKRKQAVIEEQLRLAQQQTTPEVTPSSPLTTMANRKALVIGNDSYKSVAKLLNAREDARTMASNLTSVGYQVTLKLDLNEKEMKAAMRNFAGQVQGGDEVLFFFAGHGVQLGATNYLLPTDIGGESEAQVRDESIQLQRILDDMSERKAKFTLAMIDACRDNPFKSSGRAIGGRGLAPTTAATGQMVIFSAGTGQQALDKLNNADKNKNGLFTRVFVQEMQKPNQSIDRVVKNVRNQVAELAKSVGHEQVPAIYDQVLGDFYFKK